MFSRDLNHFLAADENGSDQESSTSGSAGIPLPEWKQHTDLSDVTSGGNPLVAAANILLNLLPQIRGMATNADPGTFRQFLLDRVREFEKQAGMGNVPIETVIGARYCLCTALDEACAQSPWGGSGAWSQYSLLVALHNETWGGEKFFQLLAKLVQTPQQHIDLIELMYFCLMLGFEGRYHVIDNGRSQLETLKSRLLQVIENNRGDRSGALSLKWRGVQRSATPPWTMMPLWIAAVGTLLLGFMVYLWFNYRLARPADDLFAEVNSIRAPKVSLIAPHPSKPRLRQFLETEIREGLIDVRDEADRSVIVLRGDGLFDPASAAVKQQYVRVMEHVANSLDGVAGKIVVNGYTDDVPIRTARYPSNWHLSQARAESVANMLSGKVRDTYRVRAEGRAESDPIASNKTPEGRARNRRVEILLLPAPQAQANEPGATTLEVRK